MSGFGFTSLGRSPFGIGLPATANSSVAKLWIKSDGTQGNCAKIDPSTGDYVLDANGNSVGDDSVNQKVYLAYKTMLNSSAVSGFGFDLNLDGALMSQTKINNVKLAAYQAVKHLTDPGVITIVSVDVRRVTRTGMEIRIKWINNSTNEINTFTF